MKRQERLEIGASTLPDGLATAALEASGSVVFVTNAEGTIVWVNEVFTRVTGWSRADALGANPRILQSGLHDPGYYRQLWSTIKSGRSFSSRVVNRTRGGSLYVVAQTVTPLPRGSSRPQHFVAFQEDISEGVEHQQELEYLAYTDPLTGLGNRRALLARLNLAERLHERFALLLIDVDDFKLINDRFGHERGDDALRAVAAGLGRSRPGLQFRLGGDEFVALLFADGRLRSAAAERAAWELREAVNAQLAPSLPRISISVGVALSPQDGRDPGTLLRAADVALCAAKAGNSAVQVYERTLGLTARRESTLRLDLAAAIRRGQVSVAYQPIRDLKSGLVVSMEALAQWRHPRFGDVPLEEFLPLAERTGEIVSIGDTVLREAMAANAPLCRATGLRLAVNVSPVQLQDTLFAARLARVCREAGMPPGLLDVEIFASSKLEDPLVGGVLQDLRRLGIGVVVDAFGAGVSRLSYLADFPVTGLKLDSGLVRNVSQSSRHRALVGGIISVAHGAGLRVIGEGVESQIQLDLLRDLGCDEGQGAYLGKPGARAELEAAG